MNFSTAYKYFFTGIFVLLLYSCAQVVSPTGGPKDVNPPRVLKYMPDSASTQFKSPSIIIAFDEYIQLRDLQNQLIISPPLKRMPEVRAREKSVIVNISKEDTLKPNTTYVFSFGNSIVDLNEGNPKENFKYIFSTGDYIDSLSISGKVWTAFNHRTEKNILVMLYKEFNDSTIYKSRPDYFTKTKDDGSFTLTNLHEGQYTIIALKDVNNNYKYDDEQESIAFIDSVVNPMQSKNILLELFNEPPKKFYLKKYVYNSFGKISFYFNKGSDSIYVKPINCSIAGVDEIYDYNSSKDSLTYWFRNITQDSLKLQVGNGYKVIDTVELKLISREEAVKTKKNPLKLSLSNSPNKNQSYDLSNNIMLQFNHFVDSVIFDDSWELKIDSLQDNLISSLTYSVAENSIELKKNKTYWLKENSSYQLLIPPAKITDFFGFRNDSINIAFKTNEESYYGTLKLNVQFADSHNYIIQLLDEQENIVREHIINSSTLIDYLYLHPKKYKLKIIDDSNGNKKWDAGNMTNKTLPEKVIYNAEPVQVRSNWDLELTWDVK